MTCDASISKTFRNRGGVVRRLIPWLAAAFSASVFAAAQAAAPPSPPAGAPPSLVAMLADAQTRMVKVYGAAGPRGLAGHQSGFFISPQGHILTAWSHVLDVDEITITAYDGRKFVATLLGADVRAEIAVLKVDAADVPYFDPTRAVSAEAGERVFALSNAFGAAAGNEALSVQRSTVAVVTQLAARSGTFDAPYDGPIYVLDAVTNNSGSAGGALLDRNGRLLGVLGKELLNANNRTRLNYALPIDAIRDSIERLKAGKPVERRDEARKKPGTATTLALLGIAAVPDVVERTPPYVDRVLPGSSAAKAGVEPDDVIVIVGSRSVRSLKAVQNELQWIEAGDEVRMTILRGRELKEVVLQAARGKS